MAQTQQLASWAYHGLPEPLAGRSGFLRTPSCPRHHSLLNSTTKFLPFQRRLRIVHLHLMVFSPSMTSPKTTCLPFNQSVGATVMKNLSCLGMHLTSDPAMNPMAQIFLAILQYHLFSVSMSMFMKLYKTMTWSCLRISGGNFLTKGVAFPQFVLQICVVLSHQVQSIIPQLQHR